MTKRHEDSDDDTYVTIGAAFERLETDEDVQKAKHNKDKEQYVTDSKGRRRFHGAFTGGFSAGYFNTVGSEEGWTPSSFVSSRDKKSGVSQQKPEDFMDEEDLGAYGIAPRAVTAKEDYDQQKAGSKRAAESHPAGVIPGAPPLQNLIVPTKSSIGARLLKAMGWREGEGVGPKTMRYRPATQGKERVHSHGVSESDDMENKPPPGRYFKAAEGFMFAPRDVTPWQFEAKDDMHGIGYRGIQDLGVLSTEKSTKSLYGMSGAAFGIGALEEEEEEDNVYGVESMTSYDNTLAGEGDISMERKYGWTGGHESDWGLSSFKRASKQRTQVKRYPPPQVPRDFVLVHKFGSTTAASSEGGVPEHRKPLTSAERSQMLSDQPGSVFSLLSATDRDRLKRISDQAKHGDTGDSQHVSPKMTLRGTPMEIHSGQAQKAGNQAAGTISAEKMKPFARDPNKQARYEAYLAGERPQQSSSDYDMTEWERQKEREEFARTAKVFQPLNTALASRFTRSQDEKKDKKEEKEEPPGGPESPESDAVQAAKANMFGVLTREMEEWHPHRILCKRFNVPDPYPGSGSVGVTKGNEVRYSNTAASSATKRSIDFLHTERLIPVEQPNEEEVTEEPPTSYTLQQDQDKSDSAAPASTSEEGEDTERPPMDLFKSIFAESSAESAASSSESDMETDQKQSKSPSSVSSATTNMEQRKRRWQDLSTVANQLPARALGTTSLERTDPPKTSLLQHIPYEHKKSVASTDSLKQLSEEEDSCRQQPSAVLDSEMVSHNSSQTQDYGPALPPGFAGQLPKEDGGSTTSLRRQSQSESKSKHKHKHRDYGKTSHKKQSTKDHKKRKHKHSRHK